jgi:hypothetical protein
MFVLAVIIYIVAPAPGTPELAIALHDFEVKERCEEVGRTIQAMVRTELKAGGEVVWQCIDKGEPVRVVVPAARQHSL